VPERSTHRVVVAAALLLLACLPAQAQLKQLFGASRDARVVMVFVDLTDSVKATDVDRIYTPTLRSIVDALRPGDRFVLAEISERTLGSFAPALDLPLPSSGRSMEDNDALEAGKLRIRGEWRKLVSRRDRSKATAILDSLNAGSQVLTRDARPQRQLVILSDMIEESKTANFLKAPPNAALIEQRRAKGLLPDLHGVQVFVAGASASTSERYVEAQDFWLKYLQAAGGEISAKTYGRVALSFE
jgi:hypothetical protein